MCNQRWKRLISALLCLVLSVAVLNDGMFALASEGGQVRTYEVKQEAEAVSGGAVDKKGTPEPTAETASDGAVTATPEITPQATPDGTYADIKIVFTTDLHGHLTTTNFESGNAVKEGTLARAVTKINEERGKVATGNSFLFDIGDVLYDYSTDFMYEYDDTSVQPIFQAMATLNYDAITLGNHEFEYSLPYLVEQYQGSGLNDKVVLSNVKDANTGKPIWNENKIIERTVTATNGQQFVIKVGVVGETIPTLSKKRTDYTGVLSTEDMLQNASAQAAQLKAAGADLVVVLAHAGIGTENPESMSENVTYAMTKDPNIDVVLAGHLHKNYPLEEKTSPEFYTLPGVDRTTGLTNGKNLVMAAENGKYLGVADLTLQKTDSGVQIADRSSKILKVDSDVTVDNNLNQNFLGNWWQILIANCSTILAEIANDANYQNYFGLLEDNSGIQLVNNAKISFGLNYINTVKTDYKDLPVIGVSTYERSGMDDAMDYYDMEGDFLQSYLSSLEKYKTAIYVYQVTGAQLKEWLEWSASAYVNSATQQSAVAPEQMSNVAQTVLAKDWKNNWGTYFVFDGIEYTIDTTTDARYDFNGNLVCNSNRVKNVTINGAPILDSGKYIVVGDRFSSTAPLPTDIKANKLYSSNERCQNIIKEYIEDCSMNGTLKSLHDSNWNVLFAPDKKYIVESGSQSEDEAKKKPWITESLGEYNHYQYYMADFSKMSQEDTQGPNVVLSSLNKVVTHKDVTVKVNATDQSGIALLKYAKGKYNASSEVWSYAQDVTNGSFTCSENGLYSVLAKDGKGNTRVAYIRLTNINKSVLQAPTVDTYTNRKTKITGTASAGAQIYFEVASGKVYSTKVGTDGTFSYKLPPQKAGTTVYVYVIDSKGKTSASTEVIVKRTGPNKPTISTLKSNSTTVKGKTNDTYVIPVLFTDANKVFVAEGYLDTYKNSEVYTEGYSVTEVPVTIAEDGTYTMTLPKLLAGGSAVTLYTIDTLYRVSLAKNGTVDQKVPNKPKLATTYYTNNMKKIPVYSDEKCTIRVVIDKKIYSSSKATYVESKKLYKYKVSVPKSSSKEAIQIYASNEKGNSKKLKVSKKEAVPYAPKMEAVRPGKKRAIRGSVHLIDENYKKSTVSASDTVVHISYNGKTHKTKPKSNGDFVWKAKNLKAGTKITCWATNVNGTGFKKHITVK